MTICDLLKTCKGGESIAQKGWCEGVWPLLVPSISVCAIIDTRDNRTARFSVAMLMADDWEVVPA